MCEDYDDWEEDDDGFIETFGYYDGGEWGPRRIWIIHPVILKALTETYINQDFIALNVLPNKKTSERTFPCEP